MLVHSKSGRWAAWGLFGLLFLPLFALPLLVVVAASFATHWSGAFPSGPTTENYAAAVRGESLQALTTSLVTALAASLLALAVGTWAALAAATLRKRGSGSWTRCSCCPSPCRPWSSASPCSSPSAGRRSCSTAPVRSSSWRTRSLSRRSPTSRSRRRSYDSTRVRAGGRLPRRPSRVRAVAGQAPLLLPSLTAAAGLCFALSMGELSATMMLYPPDWMPLPVRVFTATDRGSLYSGSAVAVVLMATTLLVLLAVSRVRTRASYR